ncbi:hypothetical protein Vretifemale_8522 [Volvox reticuliferus]|uniref:Secreted protein n=1 Tax=Volvox reticuliferus TaxID=1737510 RepID=A0A8J4CFI1_9CHLO|nr:hypothetical protein Vretifemale_8522 [Volvox reticuliferus]
MPYLKMRGHCGQGLFLALVAGGLSSSSKLTMEVAPWRREVAMQSVPVSPPPITTTFLPAALMYLRVKRVMENIESKGTQRGSQTTASNEGSPSALCGSHHAPVQ